MEGKSSPGSKNSRFDAVGHSVSVTSNSKPRSRRYSSRIIATRFAGAVRAILQIVDIHYAGRPSMDLLRDTPSGFRVLPRSTFGRAGLFVESFHQWNSAVQGSR